MMSALASDAVPEDTLLDLLGLMSLTHTRSLRVVKDGEVIGTVSDRDVLAHVVPAGDDFTFPVDVTALAIMRPCGPRAAKTDGKGPIPAAARRN